MQKQNRCFVLIRWLCFGLIAMVTIAGAQAQNFPTKPIRIITSEPGGGNDLRVRVIVPALTQSLGQPVIIDNRGGNAVIPIEMAVKAPPDGYTLIVAGGAAWLLPYMQSVLYDPLKDLAPVTALTSSAAVVVVHPTLQVKSIKELIVLAKAHPGELNYASGISGSTTHLPAELFKAMAGVNIVRVPFKGAAPAVNALLAGDTQLMFAATASAVSLINSGKVRGLAVTSAKTIALLPNLPTVAAAGVPGYNAETIVGVFAPPRTPRALINRLNSEMVKALNRPDVKDRNVSSGNEVVGNTPEEFAAFIKADMDRMGKVIRDAGIRGE